MAITVSILDGINAEALAFQRAKDRYDREFRAFAVRVPPMAHEHFWPMADAFRRVVLKTMQHRQERVGERAADEFFRQVVIGQQPYDLAAAVHFALSYRTFSGRAYEGGDECGFSFDRGDDGYGDLMDAVVLLGEKFNARLRAGDFRDLSEFHKAVDELCHASVTVADFPFQHADDPVGARTSLAARLRSTILFGESYFAMSLSDAAQERVACEALQNAKEDE
jgi:hypothetical protein